MNANQTELASLSAILATMREEENDRIRRMLFDKPTSQEVEYREQFRASKLSVLKAIERCASKEGQA